MSLISTVTGTRDPPGPSQLSGSAFSSLRKRDALREHGYEDVTDRLTVTVDAVNSLPETHPSESYLEMIETAQSVAAQAGAGSHTGTLRRRERRIEATIRAKLGFAERYGSGTPEADVEFLDEDLNTLKCRLDETREERTEAEARLKELREQLESKRETWRASIREDLPP
jgi:chromosome segregation ATPase